MAQGSDAPSCVQMGLERRGGAQSARGSRFPSGSGALGGAPATLLLHFGFGE